MVGKTCFFCSLNAKKVVIPRWLSEEKVCSRQMRCALGAVTGRSRPNRISKADGLQQLYPRPGAPAAPTPVLCDSVLWPSAPHGLHPNSSKLKRRLKSCLSGVHVTITSLYRRLN